MNDYLIFLTHHLVDISLVICGLSLDIYLLVVWKRIPKYLTTLYKLLGLLIGLITICSGIMLMVTDFFAINPK
jgi:hypothetical protein